MKDKVVVITGGSDGIGKAVALLCLQKDAYVSTCGRNYTKLLKAFNHLSYDKLLCIEADVSKEDDCKKLIINTLEKFGQIDILINNAGISMRSLFQDVDLETFRQLMNTNFWGAVYCTKFALDNIIKQKGSIVSITSIAGYRGLPGRSGYSASKFALNGWMEALRTELLQSDVNVMLVAPGFTASNIRNVALNEHANPQGESPMDESNMMTSEECAEHIVAAIGKRKRSLVLTFTGRRAVFMNKYFPAWSDKLVYKFFFKNGKLIK